jgi:hypothetical protein
MFDIRRKIARLFVFVAIFAPTAPLLLSQTDPDPTPLLRAAIEKGSSGESQKTRFTYQILDHQQIFNQKGKLTHEGTTRYEIIYIADLEYKHLLEINGKALLGKALADEQKRYDDAVRERTALDANARAKLVHGKNRNVTIGFWDILTKYHNTVVEHTQQNGRDCLLIDSTPLETVADVPKRHLRIWLDPQISEFLRMDYDLLDDEEDILRGSKGSFNFIYIDGVQLDTIGRFDYIVPAKDNTKHTIRVVSDQTFSNYKKFVSTVRILPETEGETLK